MKKQNILSFLAGVLAAATLAGLAQPALATLSSKTIEVLTGVDIYVDGVEMKPTDANGKAVETFVYNGTTYVPLRAVSQSLGYNVNWDGANQRAYIGEMPGEKQYLMEVCPPHTLHHYNSWHRCGTYFAENTEYFLMGGKKYTNGLTMAGCYSADTYALFNLNGKYSSLRLTIGPVDGADDPSDIVFIVDGKIVAEYEVDTGDYPQEITVPLNGGLQLQIVTSENGGRYRTGLGNIEIY